jgi:hypothetical protein
MNSSVPNFGVQHEWGCDEGDLLGHHSIRIAIQAVRTITPSTGSMLGDPVEVHVDPADEVGL